MWYAVETGFVEGRHLISRPCFAMDADEDVISPQAGCCARPHYEEPMNSCQTFLGGLVEIHTDWFQTKDQALKFCQGTLTYKVISREHYRADIRTTLRDFVKWEAVEVSEGYEPWRGVYETLKEGASWKGR